MFKIENYFSYSPDMDVVVVPAAVEVVAVPLVVVGATVVAEETVVAVFLNTTISMITYGSF